MAPLFIIGWEEEVDPVPLDCLVDVLIACGYGLFYDCDLVGL